MRVFLMHVCLVFLAFMACHVYGEEAGLSGEEGGGGGKRASLRGPRLSSGSTTNNSTAAHSVAATAIPTGPEQQTVVMGGEALPPSRLA